jgi:hypothetical protein
MSEDPKPAMNLDPEMLAAYIDKRLTPEQRAAVEAQLASDPDSYAVLVESMKALDALDGEQRAVPFVAKKKPMLRWAIAAGVLATAAALLLVVAQPDWLQRLRGDSQMTRLVAAVGEERYFEARLSGGFKYGALRTATRGAGSQSDANLSLMAAAGALQEAAARRPDAANQHAWGVAQLLLGKTDDAIQSLSSAAALSENAATLTDLSAGYAIRATATGSAADWTQALAIATRAAASSSQPEPRFNQALAAEALNLRADAVKFWRDYLAVETRPEWRAEGERHLQRLE